jgi:hypothetical protein
MRAAALAALLLALATVTPAPASPSLPTIHPASHQGPDAFTVVLHGAPRILGRPQADPEDRAAITAIPGILAWPTGLLRYRPGIAGIADIVVAQHDPRTIWIVAHFTGAITLPEIGQEGDALTLTFRAAPESGRPHASPQAAPSPSVPSRAGVDHDGLPVSRLSAHWARVPLSQAARDITQVTGIPIALRVSPSTPISLDATDVTLRDLIDMLAAAAGARAVPQDRGYAIVPWR